MVGRPLPWLQPLPKLALKIRYFSVWRPKQGGEERMSDETTPIQCEEKSVQGEMGLYQLACFAAGVGVWDWDLPLDEKSTELSLRH